ncbi:MAG: hypothetical protein HN576_01010 [Bacteriovoracaceae bacterium]|jgi:hypothetical protein|nr:hypothetical protein [Bacteriovoracaceae bacterium]
MLSTSCLFILALLLISSPLSAYSKCKGPDWSHWKFSQNMELNRKKMFHEFVHSSSILIEAKILDTKKSKDTKRYLFYAKVIKVLKGNVHTNILRFDYSYTLSKPSVATPKKDSIWIFNIEKIKEQNAIVKSAQCGGLGFPTSSKSLMRELENFLLMQPTAQLKQSCSGDGECREISCKKINNKNKSQIGFRAACIKRICRCMCFGCK